MTTKEIAALYSLDRNILDACVMNSNLNYKCTLLKGVVVFDEPEEVLKCYEEYKKNVLLREKEKIEEETEKKRKEEHQRNKWGSIFDSNNDQFDMELRVMITVYIERMKDENRTSKEKLTEKTKISEAIDELRESIGPYNTWLMELHTPESGNLTEDLKNRWVRFIELFDIIGILDDLQQYYHNEDTMIDDLKRLYLRLYKKQLQTIIDKNNNPFNKLGDSIFSLMSPSHNELIKNQNRLIDIIEKSH